MELRAFTHEDICYEGANGGPHSCTLDLLIILTLEEEVSVGETELSVVRKICGMDMLVLCGRVLSCCNLCFTICMAGWTGTEVNKTFTSKEVMTSPGSNFFTLELLDEVLCVFEMV